MKSVVLGLDAFDPGIFERLYNEGKTPELAKLLEDGAYARFAVANPPQSEVSWTSIATGVGPAGHGIFDFVHRNPSGYSPYVSLLPTKRNVFGVQFIRPHSAGTFFDDAVHHGFPATSLWWPATFPAQLNSPVRSIPGLGTPDILGRLGVGRFFSRDSDIEASDFKTIAMKLDSALAGKHRGLLVGPIRKAGDPPEHASLPFYIEFEGSDRATLFIGRQIHQLTREHWSPFIQLKFKMSLGLTMHAFTRAILTEWDQSPGIYFLPLQIHPLHAPWPYAHPKNFIRRAWNNHGPFLSLGWPQDTTGLGEGFLTGKQFLSLCESVYESRKKIFLSELEVHHEGVLAAVFDSLDRVEHMFLRDRPDIVEDWYQRYDELVGEALQVLEKIGSDDMRLLVVSDHGFARYDYKVHLNTWLIDRAYLTPGKDHEGTGLTHIEWKMTRAYAIGLSSIYLNQMGRESKGIVRESDCAGLADQIKSELLEWEGPDGTNVVRQAWSRDEIFPGLKTEIGPDLVIGFNNGYRASPETGLGQWTQTDLEPNRDHWGADHCVDPELVPGVIFSNHGLAEARPSYKIFPELVLNRPIDPGIQPESPEPTLPEEDQEILEKRLQDLGYL